jgi:D-arabinose 1-dehydrogenase-like Zn-dependent alcohol dehydrogenase
MNRTYRAVEVTHPGVLNLSGFVAIPGGLSSVEAAPLLCAGLTTYNALECRKTE